MWGQFIFSSLLPCLKWQLFHFNYFRVMLGILFLFYSYFMIWRRGEDKMKRSPSCYRPELPLSPSWICLVHMWFPLSKHSYFIIPYCDYIYQWILWKTEVYLVCPAMAPAANAGGLPMVKVTNHRTLVIVSCSYVTGARYNATQCKILPIPEWTLWVLVALLGHLPVRKTSDLHVNAFKSFCCRWIKALLDNLKIKHCTLRLLWF